MDTNKTLDLSVIVPVYNEEGALGNLYEEIVRCG